MTPIAPRTEQRRLRRQEPPRHETQRVLLATRLRARRPHLDEELYARMGEAVADDTKTDNAEYLGGRRRAVSVALDDLLEITEQGEFESDRTILPLAVRAQVRRAVAAEVPLDTVLMRYAAARGALTTALLHEVAKIEAETKTSIAVQALNLFVCGTERAMALLKSEYRSTQVELAIPAAERRRARCVEALLAHEPCDVFDLGYAIDRWHVGVIAMGDKPLEALREIVKRLSGELLTVRHDDRQISAWLGTRKRPRHDDLLGWMRNLEVERTTLATGEPAMGIDGFRRTHQQAKAAQWVAVRRPRLLTRYTDVILLSAVIRDPELERSLRDTYLSHFRESRDAVLLDTVRAFFSCGNNISSAAAALNADRGTVGRRIRSVEQRIGRQLCDCQPEFAVALRLDEIERSAQ
jgi:PucR C-terminal helix-turn-helix domain/GGDEF-like domain